MIRKAALFLALLAPHVYGVQEPNTRPLFKDPTPFEGELLYGQEFAGDESMVWMRDVLASEVSVMISPDSLRIDRDKGSQRGTALLHFSDSHALRLDHEAKKSELGRAISIDDLDVRLKRVMPDHFATELSPVEDAPIETICGMKAYKFKVQRSAFVSQNSTTFLWVSEELEVPRRRYQFNFPSGAITPPLPLAIPIPKGSILKTEVTENNATITTTLQRVRWIGTQEPAQDGELEAKSFEFPSGLFEKPLDYVGPDFPAPDQVDPASTADRVPLDLAKLPRWISTKSGIQLRLVEPATFTMGSPTTEPDRNRDEVEHQVTLTMPYYVARTEVTQAQWLAVMGSACPSKFKGDQLPVDSLTWEQAQEFCAKLSEQEGRPFRLPTEAEWEYAATLGKPIDLASMTTAERKTWLAERSWMDFNAELSTHEVAGKRPNPIGLWDLIGNVEEWCHDGYAAFDRADAIDPAGVISNTKTTKGSSWSSSFEQGRFTARNQVPKETVRATIGLRVFADASE